MKGLWEINKERSEIIQELIENEGELTDSLEELININNNEFEEKALDYVWIIKNLENEAQLRKEEIKRLNKKNESLDKTINNLKKTIVESLKQRGRKAKVGDFNLSIKTSESVVITDIGKISAPYVSFNLFNKLSFETVSNIIEAGILKKDDFIPIPDKIKIKNNIDNVEGVEIEKNDSLIIR